MKTTQKAFNNIHKTTMATQVKATKKGVEYSDYKLTYNGKTMFAVYFSDYRWWGLQDSDGASPDDSANTLSEVKEIFKRYVDNNLV
jgi:hypothetical protein